MQDNIESQRISKKVDFQKRKNQEAGMQKVIKMSNLLQEGIRNKLENLNFQIVPYTGKILVGFVLKYKFWSSSRELEQVSFLAVEKLVIQRYSQRAFEKWHQKVGLTFWKYLASFPNFPSTLFMYHCQIKRV